MKQERKEEKKTVKEVGGSFFCSVCGKKLGTKGCKWDYHCDCTLDGNGVVVKQYSLF